jgi:hypothetical protein
LLKEKQLNYPAGSLDEFIAGHGFSGYTLTHNGKVLFIGFNAFVSLRAMEVLNCSSLDSRSTLTTGEVALVNNA